MSGNTDTVAYPRKSFQRGLVSLVGRTILPLLFDFKLTGKEHFPGHGPLIVVGNHTAAMEAVFINVYTPWQIEMLSAADIPAEKFIQWISNFYGVIPLHRGSFDRAALERALQVLEQDGVIGIFPEGGIWEEGRRKAQTGVAWLSYRSGAPVLPIGFSDTQGKLHQALQFNRPEMKMNVGQVIPPARLPADQSRKGYLQSYADRVLEKIHNLVPEEDRLTEPDILRERFHLDLTVYDKNQQEVPLPEDLRIQNPQALAQLLHKPAILKIFRVNLHMPVKPLEQLHRRPTPEQLLKAVKPILRYLDEENPYLLTYRFGPKGGLAMQQGLEDLYSLLIWLADKEYTAHITPIRKYYSQEEDREVVQIEQGEFTRWM